MKLSRQQRQLLTMLRKAGPRGVHTLELHRAGLGDPSRRRLDLKELGFDITSVPESRGHSNGRRYTLRGEPSEGGAFGPVSVAPGGKSLPRRDAPTPPQGPLETPGSTPAGRGFPGSVVLETKPASKGHRYAHQAPDSREGWIIVHSFLGPYMTSRWELRARTQIEDAVAA